MENGKELLIPDVGAEMKLPPTGSEIRERSLQDVEIEQRGMRQFLRGLKRKFMGVRTATGKTPRVLSRKVDQIVEETKEK